MVDGEYYHVFNRGVAKQPMFLSDMDYQQAMLGMNYYRFVKPPIKLSRFKRLSGESKMLLLSKLNREQKKLVDIICFVLMPNHFHFLLRQSNDGGISKFVSQFSNSYTRYFNTKRQRVGPVFQGAFKAVYVENNEQLLHLSRYIHLNPYVSSNISKNNLWSYPWSSLPQYLKSTTPTSVVESTIILSQFKNNSGYKDFIADHSDYARQLELVKHMTIDVEL